MLERKSFSVPKIGQSFLKAGETISLATEGITTSLNTGWRLEVKQTVRYNAKGQRAEFFEGKLCRGLLMEEGKFSSKILPKFFLLWIVSFRHPYCTYIFIVANNKNPHCYTGFPKLGFSGDIYPKIIVLYFMCVC